MKKTVILFCLLTSAGLAQAASTCETRVDKHQKATTLERVDYCLTPEALPEAPAGPEVIYYNVTTKTPEQQPAEKQTPRKQKYYDQNDVAVEHSYVGSKRFPAFKNDIPSEQERRNSAQAQGQAEPTQSAAQKPGRQMKSPAKTSAKQADGTAAKKELAPSTEKAVNPAKPARTMSAPAAPVTTPEIPAPAVKTPHEMSYTEWMENQATAGYGDSPATEFASDTVGPVYGDPVVQVN